MAGGLGIPYAHQAVGIDPLQLATPMMSDENFHERSGHYCAKTGSPCGAHLFLLCHEIEWTQFDDHPTGPFH